MRGVSAATSVTPAKTGAHSRYDRGPWIPAFAEMTRWGRLSVALTILIFAPTHVLVSPPQFSKQRGFYGEAFALSISTKSAGATIRYTTNGSAPTADSGLKYSGPINIAGTTVIRAAAFVNGQEPSVVETHTFIFPADVIRQSQD